MNGALNRELLAQCIIVIAVCIGGWMMIVQPKVDELASIESEMTELRALMGGFSNASVEELADKLHALAQRAQTIREHNELGRDSSQLYGLVTDIAAEHGVRVKTLQPGGSGDFEENEEIARTRLQMTVEAGYGELADFITALQKINGFFRPQGLTLSPNGRSGEEMVTARFTGEVFMFSIPDALASLGGQDDVKQ